MNKFVANLKAQIENNPIASLAVGAMLLTTATKLMQANTERNNSRTWAKEVDRRRMSSIK